MRQRQSRPQRAVPRAPRARSGCDRSPSRRGACRPTRGSPRRDRRTWWTSRSTRWSRCGCRRQPGSDRPRGPRPGSRRRPRVCRPRDGRGRPPCPARSRKSCHGRRESSALPMSPHQRGTPRLPTRTARRATAIRCPRGVAAPRCRGSRRPPARTVVRASGRCPPRNHRWSAAERRASWRRPPPRPAARRPAASARATRPPTAAARP